MIRILVKWCEKRERNAPRQVYRPLGGGAHGLTTLLDSLEYVDKYAMPTVACKPMRSTWRAISNAELEEAVLSSLAQRDEEASACPSEIARTLAPLEGESWRALMPRIRDAVARLACADRVIITRGRQILSPDNLNGGPIRVRRGRQFRCQRSH